MQLNFAKPPKAQVQIIKKDKEETENSNKEKIRSILFGKGIQNLETFRLENR